MDKYKALFKISDEIKTCNICKQGKTGMPVPGEGSSSAKIVFTGERKEAETGRPFV